MVYLCICHLNYEGGIDRKIVEKSVTLSEKQPKGKRAGSGLDVWLKC
jgi:hypothetical protein